MTCMRACVCASTAGYPVEFSRLFFSFLSFATLICHSTGGQHTEPHPYPPFLSLFLSLSSHRLDTDGIELLLSFLKVSTVGGNHTQSCTLCVCVCDVIGLNSAWFIAFFFVCLFSLSTSPRNEFLLMTQWNTLTSRVWAHVYIHCLRVSLKRKKSIYTQHIQTHTIHTHGSTYSYFGRYVCVCIHNHLRTNRNSQANSFVHVCSMYKRRWIRISLAWCKNNGALDCMHVWFMCIFSCKRCALILQVYLYLHWKRCNCSVTLATRMHHTPRPVRLCLMEYIKMIRASCKKIRFCIVWLLVIVDIGLGGSSHLNK